MERRRLTEICDSIVGKIIRPGGKITTVYLWERVRDIEDELATLRQQNAALREAGERVTQAFLIAPGLTKHLSESIGNLQAALEAVKGGENWEDEWHNQIGPDIYGAGL